MKFGVKRIGLDLIQKKVAWGTASGILFWYFLSPAKSLIERSAQAGIRKMNDWGVNGNPELQQKTMQWISDLKKILVGCIHEILLTTHYPKI